MNVRDLISASSRLIFGVPLLATAISVPLGCAMETGDQAGDSSHAKQGAEAAKGNEGESPADSAESHASVVSSAADGGLLTMGHWKFFSGESCMDICTRPTCACIRNTCPPHPSGKPCVTVTGGGIGVCFEKLGGVANQYECNLP